MEEVKDLPLTGKEHCQILDLCLAVVLLKVCHSCKKLLKARTPMREFAVESESSCYTTNAYDSQKKYS